MAAVAHLKRTFSSEAIDLRSFTNSTANRLIKTCLLFAGIFAHPLHALEFECAAGDDTRFIRMELPGIAHLCEVTVTYTNNERKVMWYADHDSLFCSQKTAELSSKYQNKWGFQCKQWPDHDGIDQLSDRQRSIVDTELKAVMAQGSTQATPYVVEGLKVASNNQILVLQFFLHEPDSGTTRDITHVINDDGSQYNTLSKLNALASYIDTNEGYTVNSALISAVTDNGAMEVITVLDANESVTGSNNSAGCYGNQTLTQQGNDKVVARTPHRFVCPGEDAG